MTSGRSIIPHLARAIFEKKHSSRRAASLCRVTSHLAVPEITRHTQVNTVRLASRAVPRSGKSSLPQTTTGPVRFQPHSNDESPPYNPSKDPVRVRRALYIFLTGAALMGGWLAYVLISATQDLKAYKLREHQLQQDEDVSDRWLRKDRDHDAEVEAAEKVMLMRPKRRRLIREAYGDVLEVSVGTGRNMDLYDTRPYSATEDSNFGRSRRHLITSLTFNDQSPVMLENAKHKWDAKQKEKRQSDRFTGQVQWVVGDAGDVGVIQRPPGGFDTIVQSYGICSMKDPVRFLQHLSSLARQPNERVQNLSTTRMQREEQDDGHGGRIFLLEHGRGHYLWLNNFLDNIAPLHADRYGCWFNKDIQKVIERSGLVVERIRRYHAGTTWEIILRPAPTKVIAEVEKPSGTPIVQAKDVRSWWKIWQ